MKKRNPSHAWIIIRIPTCGLDLFSLCKYYWSPINFKMYVLISSLLLLQYLYAYVYLEIVIGCSTSYLLWFNSVQEQFQCKTWGYKMYSPHTVQINKSTKANIRLHPFLSMNLCWYNQRLVRFILYGYVCLVSRQIKTEALSTFAFIENQVCQTLSRYKGNFWCYSSFWACCCLCVRECLCTRYY